MPRGGHLATQLVGVLGKEAQPFGRKRYIPRGGIAHRPRRAYGLQRRHVLHIGLDQVGPAAQYASPLAWRAARPVGGAPGAPRILHRSIHDGRIGHGKFGMRLPVGGAQHRKARGVGNQPAADEVAGCYGDGVRVEEVHGKWAPAGAAHVVNKDG